MLADASPQQWTAPTTTKSVSAESAKAARPWWRGGKFLFSFKIGIRITESEETFPDQSTENQGEVS